MPDQRGLTPPSRGIPSGWATIAIEDLNVTGMTRSAKCTVEKPGRRVRQKAGLNKAILDVGFGECRRQLTYKTGWYGAGLVAVDRWLPSSKTCSSCGSISNTLTPPHNTTRGPRTHPEAGADHPV